MAGGFSSTGQWTAILRGSDFWGRSWIVSLVGDDHTPERRRKKHANKKPEDAAEQGNEKTSANTTPPTRVCFLGGMAGGKRVSALPRLKSQQGLPRGLWARARQPPQSYPRLRGL